ncbi:TRI27 protein, partial [Rhabdornis inornatus]|nr:TRI27 protein [Rhabdornis inornatus]
PCSAARSLQDELTCPVCLEYFNDPVLVAECGHNFCRAPSGPPGPPRCPRHGEPLRLYCVQDRRAVCVVCHLSREHRAHTVLPAEEAAHAAEEVPQEHLSSLKKGREEAKAERERQSEELL